jgi:hypothetical protein
MGLMAGGTILSAYGQKKAADYQAEVAERNAALARRAAIDAITRGSAEAGKATMEGSRIIGKARAAAAASGVDVQSSSVIDVLGTTRMYATLNAETIKGNAAREALGYNMQASNFQANAGLARMEGAYGSASTLLTGLGSTMGMGYQTGLIPKLGA